MAISKAGSNAALRSGTSYRQGLAADLEDLVTNSGLRQAVTRAEAGQTGIDCFDAWVDELVHTGYLHNHARMWFASIWIFTYEASLADRRRFFLSLLAGRRPSLEHVELALGCRTAYARQDLRSPSLEHREVHRWSVCAGTLRLRNRSDVTGLERAERAAVRATDTRFCCAGTGQGNGSSCSPRTIVCQKH